MADPTPEISEAAKLLGRRGGKVSSAKKAEAVRENGKLGGRGHRSNKKTQETRK